MAQILMQFGKWNSNSAMVFTFDMKSVMKKKVYIWETAYSQQLFEKAKQ